MKITEGTCYELLAAKVPTERFTVLYYAAARLQLLAQ